MDNNFSGDYEFFQECEDARVEVFEMFDVGDVEDGDCGEQYEIESSLASCGWGTDEDYGFFGGDDY